MKKTTSILLFSFFIFHFSFAQQYGWTDISGNLPDYPFDTTIINNGEDTIIANISDISFINDNEGWVTTWHPWDQDSAAILHTTDGGNTWEVQMIFRACTVIHMVNQDLGWAGTDHGLIFITTDGGDTWNVQGVTGGNITGMSFVPGSDTGYLCTFDATHFHQVSPGRVVPLNLVWPGWWNSISAPSDELIWISATTSVETYEDGIVTDQPITSATYNSICFVRNKLGWGCGYEGVKGRNQGVIAGCVGKNIPWVHLQYTESPLNNIFALDDDHVWAVGFGGQIYYSENASQFYRDSLNGSNWWSNVVFTSQSHPRLDLDLFKVYFTSLQNGYAAGGYNTLLRYTQLTGVEAWGYGRVEVWPNPTQGKFKIRSAKADETNSKFEIQNVEMVDLHGKVLELWNAGTLEHWNGGTMELDISHLPAGLYFCSIYSENQILVKKIILLK